MVNGMVKWFNPRKGFGFAVSPEIEGDVFIHFSAIEMDGYRTLQERDRVIFEVVKSEKGHLAKNLRVLPKLANTNAYLSPSRETS